MKLKFANIFFTICYCLQFEKHMVHTLIPLSKKTFFSPFNWYKISCSRKECNFRIVKVFTKSFEQYTALLLKNFDDLKELEMDKVCQVWFKLAQRFYIVDRKGEILQTDKQREGHNKITWTLRFYELHPPEYNVCIHSGQSSLKYFATYQSI